MFTLKQGLLALPLALAAACTNDPPVVSVIPDDELSQVIFIDTLTVTTRTVLSDSVITNGFTQYLLGANSEASFGSASAAIAMDFNLPSSLVSFGPSPRLDSVVLSLEYFSRGSIFGNAAFSQTIEVQELDERLYTDSVYYNTRRFRTKPPILGTYSGNFRPADSITVNSSSGPVKVAPHLRIKLDNATIGQKLINAGDANLVDNEVFKNFFNGLRIYTTSLPANGDGSFAGFFLGPSYTALTVFYNDSQAIRFVATEQSMKASEYDHDFSGAAFENQLNAAGTEFERTYLQSMAGTKIEVKIPNLASLLNPEQHYAVVGARFRFPASDIHNNTGFPRPSRLLLLASDSLGRNALLTDLTAAYYGGNYSGKGYYEFNIPKFFQEYFDRFLLSGDTNNYGLFLFIPSDNPMTATRATIENNSILGEKISFQLMLTKVAK